MASHGSPTFTHRVASVPGPSLLGTAVAAPMTAKYLGKNEEIELHFDEES